jgi:hypothetical protein
VDDTIVVPTDVELVDASLRVRWFCRKSNRLINTISPTGVDDCGRRKDGELTVTITPDGSFSLPVISESRWSPFSDSSFTVEAAVLHGSGERIFDRDELVRTGSGAAVESALRSLQLIRFGGAAVPARLTARLQGDELPLAGVILRHPQSSVESSATVWIDLPGRDSSAMLEAELGDQSVQIEGRDLVTVAPRFDEPLEITLQLQVWVRLRTAEAGFVHTSCLREVRTATVPLRIENPIPPSLLEPVALVVDLDQPTSCYSF